VGVGGYKYSCTLSLTSALDRVDGQRNSPAVLPPGKRPGTHFTEDWVGPMVGLDIRVQHRESHVISKIRKTVYSVVLGFVLRAQNYVCMPL
jgi:hypothetical protein